MSEPDHPVRIGGQFPQIRFYRGNRIVRIYAFRFVEQKIPHDPQTSLLRGHQFRRLQIPECSVVVVGRLFDSLQAFSAGQPAETRLAQEQHHGCTRYYDNSCNNI